MEYKLSLLPSGIVRPGKLSIIGNGVVIDPAHLLKEISILRDQGVCISPSNLVVSESASLILPVHQAVDAARETLRGAAKIGTTGRGIGPAYEDKVARRAVRFGDLASHSALTEKLDALVAYHNVWLGAVGHALADADKMKSDYWLCVMSFCFSRTKLAMSCRCANCQQACFVRGSTGLMLDIDHGTYPFVTSSNTVAGQAATGAGTGPTNIGFVLGITKAYTTRVGSGPFSSEDFGDDGTHGPARREFGQLPAARDGVAGSMLLWFDRPVIWPASPA